MYILDTNVISELRRPDRADPKVANWASAVPVAQFYLSVITILEIERGILSVERRDPQQGSQLRHWMDNHILAIFDGRILPIDTAVAQRCAGLHVPDRQSDRDALIAATALVHGMTVVTRNIADFERSRVTLLNPWTMA